MPHIQVMDKALADLIAAGEVVERPASVVKELVENAVDAGATQVTVEIRNGGSTYIRVTDNGCGVPKEEMATAFLRHATSKISSAADLDAIGTLGFRGEALAAIAAVSRVEVLTRTAEADLGASLALEGGVPGGIEEAGCPLGTTMVVRDLFFNTPARLKFMKKDAAEGAAVFAVVQRVALSHPEVSVKFIRDGKQELLTPGDGQLKSAVYAVLGRELALGFREVRSAGEDMSVEGFASMPACCRASRSWQFFFVNGRQVKSPLMTAALEEAYKNQKMVGKFPGCVIHLTVRPGEVDVNVHPTKTEVKFQREQAVFGAVYGAVLSALNRDHTRPQAVLPGVRARDTATPNQTSLPLNDRAREVSGTQFMPASRFRPAPGFAPGRQPEPPDLSKVRPKTEAAPTPPPEKKKDSPFRWVEPLPEREPPAPAEEPPLPSPAPARPAEEKPIPAEKPAPVPAERADPAQEEGDRPRPEEAPEPLPAAPEEEPWTVRGELFHTYVLVEQGDKVLLIDKHAAHERANFDRLKAALEPPMRQALLTPAAVELGREDGALLLEHLPLLEEFGFSCEDFGGGAVLVREVPADLDPGDVTATLEEIAGKLRSGRSPAERRENLLHTMACKAAIKGGWKSGPEELRALVDKVQSGEVRYCPHGRPVAVKLTKYEIEKMFKRA